MINWLGLLPDELMYSFLARNISLNNNPNLKDSIKYLFGKESMIPIIQFITHAEHLSKRLPTDFEYDYQYIIQEGTIFPYYAPFITESKKNNIISIMKNKDGMGLKNLLGIQAGSLFPMDSIKFCPLCYKEDIKAYGQAYLHRIHHLDGINLCEKHFCFTSKYTPIGRVSSRLEYMTLNPEELDLLPRYAETDVVEMLHIITKSASCLLNTDMYKYNSEQTINQYMNALRKGNYLTSSGTFRQKALCKDFIDYYPKEILCLLRSNIDVDDESNWIKTLFRKQDKLTHPIRHILLILMLCGSLEEFYSTTSEGDFGISPWPCLNPAAEHYKEDVVTQLKVTADYKTRAPVGTFTCSCGFVYSRRGPDKEDKDRFKVGRIKRFGKVWTDKLTQLLAENRSIRSIANQLSCDSKTVLNNIQSNGTNSTTVNKSNNHLKSQYRKRLIRLVSENTDLNRKMIREKMKKEFTWLYRHDKEWLYKNLPDKEPNLPRSNSRVDWNKRDEEVIYAIVTSYRSILSLEKPIRITKSILGRHSGLSALLEYKLDKLPLTNELLKYLTESVEDFQKRRIKLICGRLHMQKGKLLYWEVVRKAGLRQEYEQHLKDYIVEIIDQVGLNHD